jgi:RNA-directed DNA polymerase
MDRKVPIWFRPRGYLHFDSPLGERSVGSVIAKVTRPSWVASHAFLPFLQYSVPKYCVREDGDRRFLDRSGERIICYAGHLDSQVYSYYSFLLSDAYERALAKAELSACVIAFRKLTDEQTGRAKCNIHLARDAFDAIETIGDCEVYAFDIKSFFDSLDKTTLKAAWCELLGVDALPVDHYNVFWSVTRASCFLRDDVLKALASELGGEHMRGKHKLCSYARLKHVLKQKCRFQRPSTGIPQGTPISAILANVYMLSFDRTVADALARAGGKYFRYCDDILCIVPKGSSFDVTELVERELHKMKLRLNTKKTDRSSFYRLGTELFADKPIQYLGFVFDGRSRSLRPGSLANSRRKLKLSIGMAKISMRKTNRIRFGKGVEAAPLFLRRITRLYTAHGGRNFISYGQRAADVMKSETIRCQVRRLDRFGRAEISRARAETKGWPHW